MEKRKKGKCRNKYNIDTRTRSVNGWMSCSMEIYIFQSVAVRNGNGNRVAGQLTFFALVRTRELATV